MPKFSKVTEERKYTFKLASLFSEDLGSILFKRGIRPENIDDIISLLSDMGAVFSPEEVLNHVFTPQIENVMPFSVGRFSDGSIGVYYSALDVTTCKLEIAYHLLVEIPKKTAGINEFLSKPRFYTLIECDYEGRTINLCGREKNWPDLVSQSESGYAFCQSLGLQAVGSGIDGFLTKSARHVDGTCLPVFNRKAIFNLKTTSMFELVINPDELDYRKVKFSNTTV